MTHIASSTLRQRRLLWCLGAVCLVFLTACGYLPPVQWSELESDLLHHPTPAWQTTDSEVGASRVLSFSRDPSSDLVYFSVRPTWSSKTFTSDAVYVYNVSDRTMSETTVAELGDLSPDSWEFALSPGIPARPTAPQRCKVGNREGVMLAGRCRELAGRSLAMIGESLSREVLFAVSADGAHPKRLWSPWGPGAPTSRSYGQHYLQVAFKEGDGEFSAPLKIAIETAREGFDGRVDWLAGDDLIVVAPQSNEWIAIVHVSDLLRAGAEPGTGVAGKPVR